MRTDPCREAFSPILSISLMNPMDKRRESQGEAGWHVLSTTSRSFACLFGVFCRRCPLVDINIQCEDPHILCPDTPTGDSRVSPPDLVFNILTLLLPGLWSINQTIHHSQLGYVSRIAREARTTSLCTKWLIKDSVQSSILWEPDSPTTASVVIYEQDHNAVASCFQLRSLDLNVFCYPFLSLAHSIS